MLFFTKPVPSVTLLRPYQHGSLSLSVCSFPAALIGLAMILPVIVLGLFLQCLFPASADGLQPGARANGGLQLHSTIAVQSIALPTTAIPVKAANQTPTNETSINTTSVNDITTTGISGKTGISGNGLQDSVLPIPILRVETGMNSSLISAVATDAARRYLAAASADKTVRIWDLVSTRLLTVLRPPLGAGDEGRLLSVAMSPSGDLVACAGCTGFAGPSTCVYLFDRKTEKLVRRIGGTKGPVNALAFSLDGRYLAAGTGPLGGVTVFRVSDGSILGEDDQYDGIVRSLAFAPPDAKDAPVRLVATGDDNLIRLYKILETATVPFRLVLTSDTASGQHDMGYLPGEKRITPAGAAFSPDGSAIAIGDSANAHVAIYSGDDLTVREEHTVAGLEGANLAEVCWSADGRHIFAGGLTGDTMSTNTIYEWSVPGTITTETGDAAEAAPTTSIAFASNILGLFASANGGLVFCANDLAFGRINPESPTGSSADREIASKAPSLSGLLSSARPLLVHPLVRYFEDAGDLLVSFDGSSFSISNPQVFTPTGFKLFGRHLTPLALGTSALSNPALGTSALSNPAVSTSAVSDAVPGNVTVKNDDTVKQSAVAGSTGDQPEEGAREEQTKEEQTKEKLSPPLLSRPGLNIENWDSADAPFFNRVKIPLDPAGTCLCMAIAPDEQSFVLGTNNSVQCFNQDLAPIWSKPLPVAALKINVCGNGKIVIAAMGDGTLHWYRMTDGKEICALFLDPLTPRWVLWNLSGDYDCSEGGEGLLSWQISHGENQAVESFSGSHFHSRFYKPELLPHPLEADLP